MADAGPGGLCRKCVGWWVSKSGPSSGPRLPARASSPGAYNASGVQRGATTGAATVAVVCVAVAALVSICTVVLLLRRARLRIEHRQQGLGQHQGAKGLEGAAADAQARCSAHAVELVVMAGEDMPTFLAHPTPTPGANSPHPRVTIPRPPRTPSPSPSL